MTEATGKKNDSNYMEKPPISLVPLKALWEVGRVMGYGQEKYSAFNWKGGLSYTRLASAAMRHLIQYMTGQDVDSETGLSHLSHSAACIMMLLETTIDRPDLDDRYKGDINGR